MKKAILGIVLIGMIIPANLQAADSSGNRADSIIMLGMAPVGLHLATLIAPPVRGATFIGSDIMVGLDVGSSSSSQSSGTSKATATYTNQGLNARYFFGNSFNASLGYHMRNYSAVAISTLGSATSTVTLDAKTSVATIGIGNHWLFDMGIWIGGDWLLASSALSQTSEATVTSTTGGGVSNAKKDTEAIGDLVNGISAASGVAVLTIGFAF